MDQELLLRNEYLVAENRILKSQLKGRLKLSDVERTKLGEIGHRLGRKALGEVAATALPDTILAWYRRLIDGSQARRAPGWPRIDGEVEQLIVRMADENRSWGYRIVGALANLGHEIWDQTVGNVLRRHGLPSAPARKHTTTWAAFIRVHLAVLAGTDFFTVEVLTLRGLVTYYVVFFMHLESRKVEIAGITIHPNEQWMQQMARNVTMEGCGTLRDCRYLLHDRDTKYTFSFRAIIESGRVKTLPLPARSPNLNAYAERWVRSVKEECLSKIIVFGERSLRRALSEYVAHYQAGRNKGSPTSCCSVRSRKRVTRSRYNVARGKSRWICEQAHQQLKEELGLDHFEGRSWQGLHRHALMTMIAYAFLQHRRLAQTARKKRIDGPPPQPSLPAVRHAIIGLIVRPPPQLCPHCRKRIGEQQRRE